jgi:hypothetical protein
MLNFRQVLEALQAEEQAEIKKYVNQLGEDHPIKTIRRMVKRLKERADKEAKQYGVAER